MRFVKKKEECSGCRACEQVCPQKCIIFKSDEEGFLYPVIDEKNCIDCKKCFEICNRKILHSSLVQEIAYAVRNINDAVRNESSSGGVFYELAMEALRRKGKVYGAAFDECYKVHQVGEETEEGIHKFMGSKYVQSDTGSSYREVKELLGSGRFVLYSGTPCQIKGLKNYLNGEAENLLCVSLVCHGVPSSMVWERYVMLKAGQYAEKPIKVSFREKSNGWRNMNLAMTFPNYYYSDIHSHDIYFQGFNQNLFLRPACYQCKAKEDLSYADIIIGDFWGVEDVYPELDDGQGVSCVIIQSANGHSYWQRIEHNFVIHECSVKDIVKRNLFLYESVPENPNREAFFTELKATGLLEESIKDNLKVFVISKEMRQQYQYEVVKRYLWKRIKGESIFSTLVRNGFYKICLYAITDLTELVAQDLLQSKECELVYLCDRNYEMYQKGIWGVQVVERNSLISDVFDKVVDMVIICNPLRENDIFTELISDGMPEEKIISIVNLIYE